jgi:hypothetical protein
MHAINANTLLVFFNVHNPKKAQDGNVVRALDHYKDKMEMMEAELKQKYNVDPVYFCHLTSTLVSYFAQYNQSKASYSSVSTIMRLYKGRVPELCHQLKLKYGADPREFGDMAKFYPNCHGDSDVGSEEEDEQVVAEEEEDEEDEDVDIVKIEDCLIDMSDETIFTNVSSASQVTKIVEAPVIKQNSADLMDFNSMDFLSGSSNPAATHSQVLMPAKQAQQPIQNNENSNNENQMNSNSNQAAMAISAFMAPVQKMPHFGRSMSAPNPHIQMQMQMQQQQQCLALTPWQGVSQMQAGNPGGVMMAPNHSATHPEVKQHLVANAADAISSIRW